MSIPEPVVVFGGTGFLGSRVVAALVERGVTVRIAVRHPAKARRLARNDNVAIVTGDVTRRDTVRRAVAGAKAAVNCVALYHEQGDATFEAVHVEGARALAEEARAAGLERLVSISGIGSDPNAQSDYIAARGRGEDVVRRAFPAATIFRPSVMFGDGQGFLAMLGDIIDKTPVMPLFGDGSVRLQPVYVGDVAEAVARVLAEPSTAGQIFELAGPEVLSFREIVRRVAKARGRSVPLLSVPYAAWSAGASAASLLAEPPITRGQVALMRTDNIASGDCPGLASLGNEPMSPTAMLRKLEGA